MSIVTKTVIPLIVMKDHLHVAECYHGQLYYKLIFTTLHTINYDIQL